MGPCSTNLNLLCYHILHNKSCACGKHAPSEDPAALNTRHMEAPPREKRARAAFFREKDAKRAAKQQRKKDKLTEKISHGGATDKDVAPTCCSEVDVEVVAVKQVEPFARGREQRAGALLRMRILPTLAAAHPTATQWSVSALWLVVPRCGRVVRAGSPRPRGGPAFRRRRACPWACPEMSRTG